MIERLDMMERVILLNADFTYLGSVTWQKAVVLMIKGKVEVLKESNKIITSAGKIVKKIVVPQVMKLVTMIRTIYKNKVPFSKRNVMIRDDFKCLYCGARESKMTIDHVQPVSKGGKSTFLNCVTACKKCNNKKDNRTPGEAKMYLSKYPFAPTIMEFIMIKTKNLGIDKVIKELFQ
jgi:5-methylcytosine-specific restriction endonuclease McrA